MKVTFYVDAPERITSGYQLYAQTNPPVGARIPGWKRIAFQVDLPLSAYDDVAPPAVGFELPDTDSPPPSTDKP